MSQIRKFLFIIYKVKLKKDKNVRQIINSSASIVRSDVESSESNNNIRAHICRRIKRIGSSIELYTFISWVTWVWRIRYKNSRVGYIFHSWRHDSNDWLTDWKRVIKRENKRDKMQGFGDSVKFIFEQFIKNDFQYIFVVNIDRTYYKLS